MSARGRRRGMGRASAYVALIALSTAVAGCGAGDVNGREVAHRISAQLERRTGHAPSHLECPDLPRKKGATITCTLGRGRASHDVEVKVLEVRGRDVRFRFEVH